MVAIVLVIRHEHGISLLKVGARVVRALGSLDCLGHSRLTIVVARAHAFRVLV